MNILKRSPSNNNILPLSFLPQLTQPTQLTQIINPYTEQLKQLFSIPESISNNIDTIINLISKVQLHFLLDLEKKMHCEDYKQFLKGLILVKKGCGDNIMQKGKKGSYQYILFQGLLQYNIKSQAQEQQTLIKIGTGYPGFALYPQILMPPRHVNLTITCLTSCYFLSISEELYTKYLKKLSIKQTDKLCQFLAEMPIFSGIGPINIRKYLVFFIPRCYGYNQIIYEEKQRNQYEKNNKEEIYFIVKGSVQIYENTKDKCLNVVSLGQRECFGLEITNQKFCVKSKDNHLEVLVLHKTILQMIKYQNPIVSENFVSFLNKLNKFHCTIITKNLKISDKKQNIPTKICKKKKKKQRNASHSLTWWGLAQNIKLQQKYKMPSPPKLTPCGYKSALQEEKSNRISLMTHKINILKRRILQGDQIYDDQYEDQQNIDKSPYQNNRYAPKIKARIRIIEARPKVVDMAQNMKKKLVNYAKNMSSFCDRLNLQ